MNKTYLIDPKEKARTQENMENFKKIFLKIWYT